MCVLMYIHTSQSIRTDISVYIIRAEASGHLRTGFFLQASPESACKNVTCQPSRIDACSQSASFQSPSLAEAADRMGCLGDRGRKQLSSKVQRGQGDRA